LLSNRSKSVPRSPPGFSFGTLQDKVETHFPSIFGFFLSSQQELIRGVVYLSPDKTERYGNLTRVYYREAVAALVVFDLARPDSFEATQKWKNDIDAKVTLPNGDPIPVVLVANKCDLVNSPLNEAFMVRATSSMPFETSPHSHPNTGPVL